MMKMNLSDNRMARIFTLCALYMAQGIPFGFVTYLLAAYLSGKGLDIKVVSNLTALATLPWVIKWIWGPLIDRFTYRPMGRRRPWILFAQFFMVVTISAMIFIPDVTVNLKLLGFMVFIHNMFASLQDVSVDALAVELLEEKERGMMNGLMFGSASLGAAFSGYVLASVMGTWGLRTAMVVQACMLCVIMLFPLLLRERDGEKLLPWTKGKATGGDEQLLAKSTGELFRLLKKAFTIKSALIMVALALCVKIAIELHTAVCTIYYIQELGWTDQEFSKARGLIEIYTLGGCLLGGFLADRVGHKRIASATTVLFGVCYIVFGMNPEFWSNRIAVQIFFGAEGALFGALSVALFAMCMDLSWPVVAGTQFTAYMATMNLSATIGKKMAGWVYPAMDYGRILLFWGVFQIIVIVVLLWFIDPHETRNVLGDGETPIVGDPVEENITIT